MVGEFESCITSQPPTSKAQTLERTRFSCVFKYLIFYSWLASSRGLKIKDQLRRNLLQIVDLKPVIVDVSWRCAIFIFSLLAGSGDAFL